MYYTNDAGVVVGKCVPGAMCGIPSFNKGYGLPRLLRRLAMTDGCTQVRRGNALRKVLRNG